MFALMKVYFSLLYDQWPIWMPQSVVECWLKCKNRNWIWFMHKCSYFRANECIFAQLVAVSRKWLRIFSDRNEKQKAYLEKKDNNNLRGVVFTDYMLITSPRSLETIQLFLGRCKYRFMIQAPSFTVFLLPVHWLSDLMLTCHAFHDSPTKP